MEISVFRGGSHIRPAQSTLSFTIETSLKPESLRIETDPQLTAEEFLSRLLEAIRDDENSAKIEMLTRFYHPQLDVIMAGNETRTIAGDIPLGQSGVKADSVCLIGAIPNKAETMFCNVCGNPERRSA